ncbi:MAG TPA: glycerophosphodiester phosphodiesterase family protein [Vicinamibacteria bacterium]|nr:glycerophosphodiester phosphodiesterase family protein [Vicinamibacteria bacterium]
MAPLIIAHRGDSYVRPENTLVSFASALEAGAEILELDVQLTRDGHVVVLHDATLDRTTAGRGDVRQMTLQEVRAVSAGYPARFGAAYAGERVPLLAEVLALVRERARLMIEVKPESVTADAEGGIEARTVAEVRRGRMEKDVALISFSRPALLRCRQLAPEIARGHLFEHGAPGEMLAGAREAGCDIVMPEKRALSEELRDRAREAGTKVATWVVDEPEELRALARFELYGVGSNRPGLLLEASRGAD